MFCFLSPEGQEKKYFAARVGIYVSSVHISGSWEVVSPFARKRKGHQVGQKWVCDCCTGQEGAWLIKISNSAGSEISKFYPWFNGFGPYREKVKASGAYAYRRENTI